MVLSPAAESLLNALLLESSDGAREWNKWRAGADLEELDRDCLAVIPLLSGRLSAWFSQDSSKDPEREKFLGICKRGWAQNQIHFRELADVWTLLARGGADPIAIAGCAAWAQLYLEEKAVRPVQSLEILIRRDRAMPAKRILLSAGWSLEPGMPEPEGPILDEFEGLWFRSPMQTAVFLAWRLKKVSPEMAAEHEAVPLRRSFEVHGTALSVVETEELLFDALTREAETPVSWKCDSILLLRNRSVDWARLSSFFRDAPLTTTALAIDRLALLRDEGIGSIPSDAVPSSSPGRLRRRFSQWWVDYRQQAWARREPYSRSAFAWYLIHRALLKTPLRFGTSAGAPGDGVTVIDAAENGGATLAEYQRYRTLFAFLTIRDIRLRYRKTWRGVLWAMLQPLLPMLIFAAIFSRVIRPELPRGPYWLFVLAGLAPWNFFANGVNYASVTFVNNFGLLNKVYFPRAFLPAASVTACLLDLLVSSTAVIVLSWWQGYPPALHLLLLPPVVLAGAAVALAAGLAAAALNVLYRDLKPAVPFLIQVWMYATPVLYPLGMIPPALRRVAWINPMTGVVEAFRAALFGSSLDWSGEAVSALAALAVACCSAGLFRKVEADLAERI
jgi:lipopolysaccharide transport system permease protein